MPTVGVLNKQYVSALELADRREIHGRVQDVANERQFLDILKYFGRVYPTVVPWYHNHVNEDLIGILDTTGEAAFVGSGTAQLTIVCTAATSGQARQGDVWKLGNRNLRVMSKTTAGGKDTLIFRTVDNAAITASVGAKLSYVGPAAAEGSNTRETLRHRIVAYYNHIQIMTESHISTDIQNMSMTEVSDASGNSAYTFLDYAEKINLLKKGVSGTFLAGQISSTRFSDASPALIDSGYGVQTTMGLDQYVTIYGGQTSLDTAGTCDMDDINQTQDQMLANKSPKKFMVWGSSRAKRPIMDFLMNLNSGGLFSGRLMLGKEIDLDVQKFKRSNFEYQFIDCATFDDPNVYPQAAGFNDIGKSLYYIPVDNVALVGGGTAERIRVRYLDNKKLGMSGPNVKWTDLISESITGGNAPIPTNGSRTRTVDWSTYQGIEILGAKHFHKEVTVS